MIPVINRFVVVYFGVDHIVGQQTSIRSLLLCPNVVRKILGVFWAFESLKNHVGEFGPADKYTLLERSEVGFGQIIGNLISENILR